MPTQIKETLIDPDRRPAQHLTEQPAQNLLPGDLATRTPPPHHQNQAQATPDGRPSRSESEEQHPEQPQQQEPCTPAAAHAPLTHHTTINHNTRPRNDITDQNPTINHRYRTIHTLNSQQTRLHLTQLNTKTRTLT
ncbi:hypothetical protein NKH18_40190 [Streptomyces sp. M10(2022)]